MWASIPQHQTTYARRAGCGFDVQYPSPPGRREAWRLPARRLLACGRRRPGCAFEFLPPRAAWPASHGGIRIQIDDALMAQVKCRPVLKVALERFILMIPCAVEAGQFIFIMEVLLVFPNTVTIHA